MSRNPCTRDLRVHRASFPSRDGDDSSLVGRCCGRACAPPGGRGRRRVGGTRSRSAALLTEDEATHLVAQLLYFFRIGRCPETLCQRKEGLLFFLLCLESLFDQLDQHAVVAETSFLGDAFDLLGQPRGQGYASPNLFGSCHVTTIHHYGAPPSKTD